MQQLLGEVPFRDPERAREEIARIGSAIPADARARIRRLLASVADPDQEQLARLLAAKQRARKKRGE